MKKEVNTVIIGAGICGLSAAHFLSKKRSDFLILEASNLPGGIIKTKIEKHKNRIVKTGSSVDSVYKKGRVIIKSETKMVKIFVQR